MSPKRNEDLEFSGFRMPRYFPCPDSLVDILLPDLNGAELKVLLYLFRRILGFHKRSDSISLNQLISGLQNKDGYILDRGTGLARSTITKAINHLEKIHAIKATRKKDAKGGYLPTQYQLNIVEVGGSLKNELG